MEMRADPAENDFFVQAETLYRQGKLERALSAYALMLQRFPLGQKAPEALARMAEIFVARGDNGRAREAWRRLLRDFPDSPPASAAAVALLESLAAESRHRELIDASRIIGPEQIPPPQRAMVLLLMGDANRALNEPLAAVNLYLQAWWQATEPERPPILARLRETLPLLEEGSRTAILEAIEDAPLRDALGAREKAGTLPLPPAPLPPKMHAGRAIGCLLPLSGNFETLGQRALKGIELALSRFNESHEESPVEMVLRDTGSDGGQSVQAVAELAAEEKVLALLGAIGTPEASASEAQAAAIPILVMSQKESLPGAGGMVFNNFFTPRSQVEALVNYAVEVMGLRRFALLYPEEPYGRNMAEHFQQTVQSRGAQLVGAESYSPQQTDYSGPIRRVAGLSPAAGPGGTEGGGAAFDALFIPDSPGKVVLILPQLAYHGIADKILLGTNLWHAPSLVQMGQPFVRNAILPDGFFADSTRHHVASFSALYRQTYNEEPGYIEAVAYDSAMILFETVSRPGVKNRGEVRDALSRLYRFEGVTGLTSFANGGASRKKLFILGVRRDSFVELSSPF